jgi:SAM-dependent methyltransferase
MLEVAVGRLPGVPLHEVDMLTMDLGRRFDAVTCLFSSIGYAHTPERLQAAVATMARHLEPGGVLVLEPWLWPDMIREPLIRIETTRAPIGSWHAPAGCGWSTRSPEWSSPTW